MVQENEAPEEIRFAVVMNGGVSLAVWMGGVVREIDRLTHGKGPYGRLLGLLDVKARADVIAGTSAGGINGAALALGQVNKHADVGLMRDLWSEQGRMEALLQRPFKGSPASLLRGDEYFLPKLYEAMKQLCAGWEATEPADHPIELILTTTLLHGARIVTVDALGQQLPQMLHEGTFTFRRGEAGAGDFELGEDHKLAAALAMAARCTAGFPVAFEPCFVPARSAPGAAVGTAYEQPYDLADPSRRPDLGDYVSWRTAGPREALPPDRSRYAMDGGLLANTPTKPALDAVAAMPASGLVQRVMLLVYPHAPTNRPDPPDRVEEPPTVTGALTGVLGALLSQGNRTFVNEVVKHNEAATARRGTRLDIMGSVSTPDELRRLAKCVFEQYRNQRIRRAARDLAARVEAPVDWSLRRIGKAVETAQREWAVPDVRSLPYVPQYLPTEADERETYWRWGITAGLDLADAAMDLMYRLISVTSDASTRRELAGAREQVSKARTDLRGVRDRIDKPWMEDRVLSTLRPGTEYWTLRLAHYARSMLNDESRVEAAEQAVLQTEHVEEQPPRAQPDRRTPFERRQAELRARLRGWRPRPGPAPGAAPDAHGSGPEATPGADGGAGEAPPGTSGQQAEVPARVVELRGAFARLRRSPAGVLGVEAEGAVELVVDAVAGSLGVLGNVAEGIAKTAGLSPWQTVFADPSMSSYDGPDAQTRVLARMLWLHVVSWTLADESGAASSQPVELVQLSLQARNDFATQSITADDKVGGMSLNRFGGFLKRSWRMNDWAWGRMDAATTLCQTILSPERLRRRAIQRSQGAHPEQPHEFVDTMVAELFDGPCPEFLEDLATRAAIELIPVYDVQQQDLPASLPNLSALAAWAVHLRAIVEELPSIESAVTADRVDRANPDSKGELFLIQNKLLLDRVKTTPTPAEDTRLTPAEVDLGREALRAFDRAGIGREPLDEEARSDQLIRTAATAASVAVTVADSNRSGLSAIKPITRALRGGMMMPYWTVIGLAGGGTIARFLAQFALASGALLLALSLFGVIGGWAAGPATAIGVGALLTAFGYAAARTGTLLHSVVLLTPVIPLIAFAADGWVAGDKTGRNHALAVAGTIVALALALMFLGSLPSQVRSPVSTLYRALDGLVKKYLGVTPSELLPLPRFVLRLLAGIAWIVVVVVGLAVVAAGAYGLAQLVFWIDRHAVEWKNDRALLVLVAIAFVAVGLAVGYFAGWWLRCWADQSTTGVPQYKISAVRNASGVAATWSVIYGTCYAIVAVGLIWWWPAKPDWVWRSALATAVVFALVLLFVVPLVVLLGSVRAIGQRLAADARCAVIAWPATSADEPEVVALLWRLDVRFRCLLATSAPNELRLTGRGRALRTKIDTLLAET
ncbi:patatin-like protein [Kribbella sp. CA-245084]|uniref:patatin-like protein n=1 Tax=Kribbella sp. CA-245084 TaxID=3239940 RepID=UPI003D914430